MMKDRVVSIVELETLTDKVTQLANMANALHAAMYEGPNSAEDYDGAMYLFLSLLCEHARQVQAFYRAASDSRKEGGGAA